MKKRVFVSGFQPFGGRVVNPSERMCRILDAAAPAGPAVTVRVLPVAYRRAFAPVAEALDEGRFDAALLLGLAPGRATIDFERIAVNWRGGPGPDEDGLHVAGEKIDPAGPAAYFATAPVDDLVAACRAAGAPAGVSSHAGTFLCNQVFYQALQHCDRGDIDCSVVFAHLPLTPEMASAGEPAMSEESMAAGLRAALAVLADASD
jgi:pyroglutamyl-peptidase